MAAESTDMLILDRKKSRKHKPTDMEINLTSMIDVLFMLMLFFLLGTRFGAHEGILVSHLPQTSQGQKGSAPPIPPVVIKLSERVLNKVSCQVGIGDAIQYEENFEVFPADPLHPEVFQINDTKLFDRLLKVRKDVADHLADVTVKIVPEPSVQWNYCLQVLNTVSRAKFPEIRWSVPTKARAHS